ncbi:P-loop containing nucleoside triphosphate hydrolase protein [Penicillium hispanicum]|uniref:P-loop containing nucleoside triphosphate hydrolase protein n=1 Tax=Penicillium hispanicum TaxID=1080232 RepID=UPI002540231E|nr:P-loop containing nucleoside triphosphate hydrolase protein [Penicillium hispanicum]KAJ5587013.1 P-loop containing nucleoside triphosphate hydrolase protein [Penicillium hispanicum]
MTNSTEALELAEIAFYAIASLPAFYCFFKHGKHGLVGWLYVIAMCGLRLVGNGMAYHALATTGKPNVAASIISGIGLSPLVLAALGILKEANTSIQHTLSPFLSAPGMLIPHLVLGAGIGLAAASSHKTSLLKVGMIIFALGWLIVVGLVLLSFKAGAHNRRADGEKKLLFALMIAMPLIGVRIIYAVAVAFVDGNASGGSLAVRVIFGTIPEFLIMIDYLSAGLITHNVARERLGGKPDPIPGPHIPHIVAGELPFNFTRGLNVTSSLTPTVMMSPLPPCSVADEDVFGPTVSAACRHGFDFTLLFEEIVLTLLPLFLVSLVAPIRFWKLWKAPEKVNRSWLYAATEITHTLHIALQFSLFILWSQPATPRTRATVPTAIAALVVSLLLLCLSHIEHLCSSRPSTTICVFLGFTLLLDLARLRTLSFLQDNRPVTVLFTVSWVVKSILLVVESTGKRSFLKKPFAGGAYEETSGVFSRSLFWWLNSLLWKGSRNTLTVDDLPELDDDLKAAANPQPLIEKWHRANKYNSNALLWTFVFHYKWAFLEGVLPRLAYTGFTFAQPFLVERVLDFMTEPEHVNSTNYARGLSLAYAIVYIGIAISFAVYKHKTFRLITMVRGSLVTLIFDKTLRISTSGVSDAAALTLMSTDIDRIGTGLVEMHETYSNFTEVVLALWLLARLLNVAMIASTVVVVVCLIAGIPLAIASGKAQGTWLEAVEERVSATSNVLGVMKNIKMTGLAAVVSNNLRALREREIKASTPFRLYTVINVTVSYVSTALAPVSGFGLYILLAQAHNTTTLTNGIAFSALTLFSLLDYPIISLADGSEDLMAIINCFQRIQKHLLETERADCRLTHGPQPPGLIDVDPIGDQLGRHASCAIIRGLSAAWSVDEEPVLTDLSVDIASDQITMVIGPVGCGKSTFLKVLLGEIPECAGVISTTYRNAAYCSQSPWITFGTIQENIVGASQWDRPWYDRIIQACALQVDLQQLPAGDKTKVGVRGSRLSGGQQMRVSLARALYSREPVLILDDVLTGLDRETEKFILEAVFGPQGLLKETARTVILATNSAHHLSYADYIISLGGKGQLVEHCSYEELFANQDRASLLSVDSTPVNTSRVPDVVFDDDALQELNLKDEDVDMASRQTGDLSVYKYYFQTIGWPLLSLGTACCVLFIFSLTFPQIWLQWWTTANEKRPNEDIGYWLGGYVTFGLLTLLSTFVANWVFGMIIVPRTARCFHEILLTTTISATTSFLTSTDIGATTNRFSQDLELIDDDLPSGLELTINAVLSCLIEGFLVFVGSSYVTAAVIPFCAFVVYYVARYYVRTSRQIRLLDIEAKAPLFSQFLGVLSGLPSIRAYGWTEEYLRQNQVALDTSQRPYYILYCIQRWLNLVLDLIVAVIAIIVIAVATSLRGNSSLNLLGITLFNIVNFSATLQMLVAEWTQLETSIGAISRVRSYVQNAKTEDLASESETVPDSWPCHGIVQISGVSATYDSSAGPVLRDVTLNINAGEKIALCGRTGSGKSSLVSTLLRVLDVSSGSIFIDGVDISKISRARIRSSLNTIPQQAFFLQGTVRLNANPQEDLPDDVIVDAFQAVKLWTYIESKGGLDIEMSDELFSHGQQQLFCLARALCKSSKILIMDESTSSVDEETDKLMQEVIRSHFKDQTVITIAHKLDTVLDYNKIAFLDRGGVVEFDTPKNLLSRDGSAFKAMYNSFREGPER